MKRERRMDIGKLLATSAITPYKHTGDASCDLALNNGDVSRSDTYPVPFMSLKRMSMSSSSFFLLPYWQKSKSSMIAGAGSYIGPWDEKGMLRMVEQAKRIWERQDLFRVALESFSRLSLSVKWVSDMVRVSHRSWSSWSPSAQHKGREGITPVVTGKANSTLTCNVLFFTDWYMIWKLNIDFKNLQEIF